MDKFIIKGTQPLEGTVCISGNKNLATPLIASSILFDNPVLFTNVPEIEDVKAMIGILESMGAKTKFRSNTLELDSSNINPRNIDQKLTSKIRSSVLFIGPILAKFGYIKISQPGGCKIGVRPVTSHLNAFKDLGADVNETSEYIELKLSKDKLHDNSIITLDEFSVTATENLLLFLSLVNKKFTIKLAAAEPHIQELCSFLTLNGIKINLQFPHTIKIEGVKGIKKNLKPFNIDPDYAEAGTFIIMGALSKGKIKIANVNLEYLDVILNRFKKIGVNFRATSNKEMIVNHSHNLKSFKIQTMPYPGFPTELQPQMGVLATQTQGISYIHEILYEGRLKYLEELNKMGANSILLDSHRAVVIGPTPLYGKEISSLDIRSGIALITAALIAQGETVIKDVYQIDRGYEKIDRKLENLGVNIKRVQDS